MRNNCKYEHIKAYSTEKYKSIEQNLLIHAILKTLDVIIGIDPLLLY